MLICLGNMQICSIIYRNRVQENRGPELVVPLRVTLQDIFFGKQMEVKYTKQGLCPHCRGNGAEDSDSVKKCDQCDGRGFVLRRFQVGPGFFQQVQEQYH